ncbi:MAG: alpha/beta hydrolase [Myxococcales bacterium]|jgi:pimeloyl-ACP methyl ester carboxylesterase
MPEALVNGVRLHYEEWGQGEETVVFSHSYLVDSRHFEPQIEALRDRFRVIAYDHRGHGRSEKVAAPFTMEDIYADGVGLIETLQLGAVHWVGLSTGGFVGMRIAARRPELLRKLVLMDTSAAPEPRFNRVKYALMFAVVRRFGMGPTIGEAMKAMFGPQFLRDPARAEQRARWRQIMLDGDVPSGMAFGNAIFTRDDQRPNLGRITVPTLVLHGECDRAVPPSKAQELATAIHGARVELIPRGGHLCTIEEPDAVNRHLQRFLAPSEAESDGSR